jgi:hypothetical protein
MLSVSSVLRRIGIPENPARSDTTPTSVRKYILQSFSFREAVINLLIRPPENRARLVPQG